MDYFTRKLKIEKFISYVVTYRKWGNVLLEFITKTQIPPKAAHFFFEMKKKCPSLNDLCKYLLLLFVIIVHSPHVFQIVIYICIRKWRRTNCTKNSCKKGIFVKRKI